MNHLCPPRYCSFKCFDIVRLTITPGKKRPAEHYESDDGFVANDGSDTNAGPKAKKAKKEAKAKRKLPSDEKKEQFWEVRLSFPRLAPISCPWAVMGKIDSRMGQQMRNEQR